MINLLTVSRFIGFWLNGTPMIIWFRRRILKDITDFLSQIKLRNYKQMFTVTFIQTNK